MSFTARLTLLSAGTVAASALASLAPAAGHAADLGSRPVLAYDMTAARLTGPADDAIEQDVSEPMAPDAPARATQAAAVDPQALECMAKVVMHEAGREPRAGKIAVAQTLVNRLGAGGFGGSICDVVGQRGQYFDITSYHPARDSDAWAASVAVAQTVLSGDADDVAPGAMFFRAASSPTSAFFRSRERVALVGTQVFYR